MGDGGPPARAWTQRKCPARDGARGRGVAVQGAWPKVKGALCTGSRGRPWESRAPWIRARPCHGRGQC
jgi:hypothetical protein